LGNSSSGSGAASLRRVKKTRKSSGPDFAAILQQCISLAFLSVRYSVRISLSRRLHMQIIRFTGFALVCALATATHAQTYKLMLNFDGQPTSGPFYLDAIAQSRGGYLVTASAHSGSADVPGEAFRVTTSDALTVLHTFSTTEPNSPLGGLTLGPDGEFYGTTELGGTSNTGSVFKMTSDGVIKTLHEFGSGGGGFPYAPPVLSTYGDYYGTTYGQQYDTSNPGTIYKIDSAGKYTRMRTLSLTDGLNPGAPLVQSATDLSFYGTAQSGGSTNRGTIFRIDSTGNFQVVHNFIGADGGTPGALIQANDGNFYGATSTGGAYNDGVIFKMTPSYEVTVLYSFTDTSGSRQVGGLLQGSDGYLYGTTTIGGANRYGSIFRISTGGGNFTVLHSFRPASGILATSFMQHTNGFFYGDTYEGGSTGWGVFFRLDMGLPPFVTYLNTYGRVGMTVDLLGDGFTTDSQVSFNGVAATAISDVENTFMKVVIPAGATTGPITVTTTKGTLTSNKVFVVRP
jgi:uncharacterized repeat protein (TIGR03803 family)